MVIKVGADPEVFVQNKQGRFRSAHGLVPGTKQEPHPVKDGAVQVDGLALEFNTTPAESAEQFVHNIGSVLGQLAAMVPDYNLAIVPTARFHWAHLKVQPEEALELGCEPDFDAYTERENDPPNAASTMRTAAGHIHLGFTEGADVKDPAHMQQCITLVKTLDVFLGLPSLSWDSDRRRRSMYGKAGCFRPKPYGVEYRTLSNAWLKDARLVAYVFDQVQAAVDFLKSGERFSDKTLGYIQGHINTGHYFPGMFFRKGGIAEMIKLPPVECMTPEAKVYL